MIEWLSTWAEQVIVAVIIATILEMVLPNGNNKKYIKTVIGVYILFTIVSPIIGKITGTNLSKLDFDYEKYFKDSDTYQTMSESLSKDNNETIEEIYQSNLKTDMKNKLLEKGYIAKDIQVEMKLEDSNSYGKITKISMIVVQKKESDSKEELTNNNINTVSEINTIDEIKIGNSVKKNTQEVQTSENNKEEVKLSEINELKSYLSSVYEVNKKQIEINKKGD